jgi:hypothetical protein
MKNNNYSYWQSPSRKVCQHTQVRLVWSTLIKRERGIDRERERERERERGTDREIEIEREGACHAKSVP